MGNKREDTTWTPEKTDRLKMLVLKYVSNGGTVMDACQQFELETNGAHKARVNQLKWMMSIRQSCKEEFKRAIDLGLKAKMLMFDGSGSQKEVIEMQAIQEDELTKKLYQVVEQIVEDRRQISVSLQDHQQQVQYYDTRLHDLEEEKKMAELRYEKKERELEKLNRDLSEKQTKYNQLAEDYQQLRTTDAQEHGRLHTQLKELQSKYETLMADYSRFRSNSAAEVEKLESSLREEQVKNTQLQGLYEQVRIENMNLTKRITDFAHQITSVLSIEELTKTNQTTVAPIPIRAVVSKDTDGAASI